jgi:hypothetical protein
VSLKNQNNGRLMFAIVTNQPGSLDVKNPAWLCWCCCSTSPSGRPERCRLLRSRADGPDVPQVKLRRYSLGARARPPASRRQHRSVNEQAQSGLLPKANSRDYLERIARQDRLNRSMCHCRKQRRKTIPPKVVALIYLQFYEPIFS